MDCLSKSVAISCSASRSFALTFARSFFSNPNRKNKRLPLLVAIKVRALRLLPRPGNAMRFLTTEPPISAAMSPGTISTTALQSIKSVSSVLRI